MRASPQQIRFCTTPGGVRIAYAKVGKGPPLVKTAHWLSHIELDWDSPVWRPMLTELSRDHTFVRYDGRGCGLSDWSVTDFSFDACLADLEAVVDAAALHRFALLGMSQGAPLAIAYAVRHPDRVSQLILCGGFTRGRLKRGSREDIEEAKTQIKLIELGWGRENPAFRQLFTTQFLPEGTLEQLRWFNELQRISTSPANAARIVDVINRIDVRELATRIAVPTLVLHVRGDARVPFEEGRLLASLIPDARFVPLSGNNHVLLDGEPAWSQFLAEVRAFLGVGDETPANPRMAQPFADLTEREAELLALLAQGLDNAEIARSLRISAKTVRNHITSIFDKLQVPDRSHAIVKAREAGFGRERVVL